MAIYMWRDVQVPADALYFEANSANSTIQLSKNGSPTSITVQTSTDGATWSDYTFGTSITLSNVGDKIYFRNKSETPTGFSTSTTAYYTFVMTGSISAHGDVCYLLCKNSTDTTVGTDCFCMLFDNQTALTTAPSLTATTLTQYCYEYMFRGCTNLETLPKLPATTLQNWCYGYMFNSCSKIKLSTTQTGEYQNAYRIPTTGTGIDGTNSMYNMFKYTGGAFKGTPTINTTYYTSNTLV